LLDVPGFELDQGGIGKGDAVDRVVALLRTRDTRSALVNLGGSSVYGLGAPPGADAWEIARDAHLRLLLPSRAGRLPAGALRRARRTLAPARIQSRLRRAAR
jgi:hypothetical protein